MELVQTPRAEDGWPWSAAHQVWDTVSHLVGSTQVVLKSIAGFPGPHQLHSTTAKAEGCEWRCRRSPKPAAKEQLHLGVGWGCRGIAINGFHSQMTAVDPTWEWG